MARCVWWKLQEFRAEGRAAICDYYCTSEASICGYNAFILQHCKWPGRLCCVGRSQVAGQHTIFEVVDERLRHNSCKPFSQGHSLVRPCQWRFLCSVIVER